MTNDLSKPFYTSVQNHTSDKCPSDKKEIVDGLNKAVEATKRKIDQYKKNKFDTSELETHLKNLENWLERESKK
ncbi:MAG: hypothetical protein A3B86_01835 [Candidatus Yanofskybacteria bacterium RIFCSPHIGHO2_02_FULL_38_22b]|uniref:Uncharacterized protein n=1 Tax=Candidatus Yanofskybacteria bacterium RIFCSPHIGHO2_02_FULL_38_22b TaxID=1802673 RepID=A0A1F8F3F9_9BACT|nr:MAG: hypothetical protein A2816_00735 [Candidatus Yanofskybacteria bacterium RIFCSPHIGHO2_01_FULL_39_44]OGN07130.1 MAG: hypothetical protein A3B86_01835 [Candidatus Yanofskybacteria bacterium RIFCSPHIGHO2_02_FULL_38_22b]OGN19980.1 MAG: hypothetical protein A2910_00545 [Candidatus Yanofskybacteria bacterium RIFCSPLOWO2_01_FULL_39_28]